MKITNGTVIFDFTDKVISRRVANTHARPRHQPIYIEKDRTDTDIYICSQNYYKENNIENITDEKCPNYERILIEDFKLRKDVFNSYVISLKTAFDEYGLNEFYKGDINDIYSVVNDLSVSLFLLHTTQQKVRIGIVEEREKQLIFDSLIGDLSQITFDFATKEISLTIPRENLFYVLEEVGKDKNKIKEDPSGDYKDDESIDNDQLVKEAKILQMYHDELIKKFGEDGTVIHEMLKTRSSGLQSYFRQLLLEKFNKCLLCDITNEKLLIASHIKPASTSNTIEKSDINNGLLLCPLHDKLFDKGYITFLGKTGELILDKSIIDNKNLYRLDTTKRYPIVTQKEVGNYMNYHNKNIFKGDV